MRAKLHLKKKEKKKRKKCLIFDIIGVPSLWPSCDPATEFNQWLPLSLDIMKIKFFEGLKTSNFRKDMGKEKKCKELIEE